MVILFRPTPDTPSLPMPIGMKQPSLIAIAGTGATSAGPPDSRRRGAPGGPAGPSVPAPPAAPAAAAGANIAAGGRRSTAATITGRPTATGAATDIRVARTGAAGAALVGATRPTVAGRAARRGAAARSRGERQPDRYRERPGVTHPAWLPRRRCRHRRYPARGILTPA